jgi:DNA polymerase-3 subunit alpha
MNLPHLAIHSKYEICNSNISFDKLIEKAKFLGVDTLAIVDRDTLGGTFSFQNECKKAGINFILGETVTVKRKDETYLLKLYVKNKKGWQNLLRIHKDIRVTNRGYVEESVLYDRGAGLFCVIPCDSISFYNKAHFYKASQKFEDIYFQVDATEWTSNERDKNYLNFLGQYLKELYPICKPILMSDSYYLDQDEAHIKQSLNTIGKRSDEYSSTDQHFKNINELKIRLSKLFKSDSDIFTKLWDESVSNTIEMAKKCKFEIQSEGLKIPPYKMSDSEAKEHKTNEELFVALIFKGLERIGKADDEKYLLRIEEELSVIKKGGFIDYFLVLVDVYQYANKKDITLGVGRGSVGGSLIAYCVGLIKIDPIEYNLLFSRFLNEARIIKEIEKNMIVLDTDEGEVVLEPKKEVNILRNSKKMSILAEELELNDEIL